MSVSNEVLFECVFGDVGPCQRCKRALWKSIDQQTPALQRGSFRIGFDVSELIRTERRIIMSARNVLIALNVSGDDVQKVPARFGETLIGLKVQSELLLFETDFEVAAAN